MNINKQRLILQSLFFYLPFILCLISFKLFNNFILFFSLFIYLMLMCAILSIFKNRNSTIKYLYDNIMSDSNIARNRSPIIFWGSIIVTALIIVIFMMLGWLLTDIGYIVIFAILYGLNMFMQCVTFNFENKKG
ncbi:hypothetical protein [Apilactobacillus micheneri]|uniref:hypothetical protein n=1 Tax=Apilactobacillus micheneri TaxID=1899430 RepID=UPI000D51E2BF|nr:hypothetical protein [Apilactobacillus micheneri]GAY79886.1 hypothetical protein NBRC113063_00750 [Apilactobacillus micheneri]